MFEELKQIRKLKAVQKSLEEEKVEVEKNGNLVSINGNFEVLRIQLNAELKKEEQEKILAECFNEAVRKIKATMAQKFRTMI